MDTPGFEKRLSFMKRLGSWAAEASRLEPVGKER